MVLVDGLWVYYQEKFAEVMGITCIEALDEAIDEDPESIADLRENFTGAIKGFFPFGTTIGIRLQEALRGLSQEAKTPESSPASPPEASGGSS